MYGSERPLKYEVSVAFSLFHLTKYKTLRFDVVASCRRRSRSASTSGSSSTGSPSPKKAVKRISNTPPRKQPYHRDTSTSPAGKDRRSPSPRGRRGRASASPSRSSGRVFHVTQLCILFNTKAVFLQFRQFIWEARGFVSIWSAKTF